MHVALWCSIAHFQRLPGLSTVDLLARVASANAAWNSEYVYLDSDIPMFKIVIYTLLSVFENSPSGARAASWLSLVVLFCRGKFYMVRYNGERLSIT